MQNTLLSKVVARKSTISALALTVLLGAQMTGYSQVVDVIFTGASIDSGCAGSAKGNVDFYEGCVDGSCSILHAHDANRVAATTTCILDAKVARRIRNRRPRRRVKPPLVSNVDDNVTLDTSDFTAG